MTPETFEPQNEDNYSPLDAPVKKRDYTSHNIEPATFEEIPEPEFIPPSFNDFDDEPEETTKEPDRVFNESYSELGGKEKKMGAEMMAEMALDIYSKGCGLLGKLPEISESKIDRLMAEGEIDYNAALPTAQGDIPIKEFAQEYNESIKSAFEVSNEFKENVRPPLIRVFQKRGIGMTDEQLLMYYFGTDIAVKGFQALTLKKQANSIIDALRENTQVMRQTNTRQPQNYQSQNYAQTNPEPSSYKEPTKAASDESFTDDIHSTVSKESKPEKPVFVEPEETPASFVEDMTGASGFQVDTQTPSGMPDFGNPDTLQALEDIANGGTAQGRTRKTRATRQNKPTKTPRNKK